METHFSATPQKGVSSQKSQFSLRRPVSKWGYRIFDSKRPFLGWGEIWGFSTLKPSFSDFGVLAQVRGERIRN